MTPPHEGCSKRRSGHFANVTLFLPSSNGDFDRSLTEQRLGCVAGNTPWLPALIPPLNGVLTFPWDVIRIRGVPMRKSIVAAVSGVALIGAIFAPTAAATNGLGSTAGLRSVNALSSVGGTATASTSAGVAATKDKPVPDLAARIKKAKKDRENQVTDGERLRAAKKSGIKAPDISRAQRTPSRTRRRRSPAARPSHPTRRLWARPSERRRTTSVPSRTTPTPRSTCPRHWSTSSGHLAREATRPWEPRLSAPQAS